jgi:hypothetical protein
MIDQANEFSKIVLLTLFDYLPLLALICLTSGALLFAIAFIKELRKAAKEDR